MMDEQAYLTPGELAKLAEIRFHALLDRGDIRPMALTDWQPVAPGSSVYVRTETTIPLVEAINLRVDANGEIIARNIPPAGY